MNSPNNQTFSSHFSALRQTLLSCLGIVVVGFVLSLFFHKEILHFFTYPLRNIHGNANWSMEEIERKRITNNSVEAQFYQLPPNAALIYPITLQRNETPKTLLIAPGQYLEIEIIEEASTLVTLTPFEGMMVTFKLCFWISLILLSPFWLYQVIQFLLPGLHTHEKAVLYPFIALSVVLLGSGILFAYSVTLPFANYYLYSFSSHISKNLWTLSSYIDFSLSMILSTAFVFEIFAVLFFLVHMQIISAEFLRKKRRHVIVAAFIIGALLTPPDVFTQFLLAVPLILIYELTILYARVSEGKYFSRRWTQMNADII